MAVCFTPSVTARWALLFLALALLLSASASAEERRYYFDAHNEEPGLAQHTVTAFFQSRAGYMWIGTRGGLHAYDGYRYRLYQHDADDSGSLPDSDITAIAEDGADRLWIGSSAGNIASLDPLSGNASVLALPADTPDRAHRDNIGALASDRRRGLWIGTAAGIELLSTDRKTRREWFRFAADGAAEQRVCAFALAPDGALWAATTVGVLRVAPGSDHADLVATQDIGRASALLITPKGSAYIGTPNGLFRVATTLDHAERLWPPEAASSEAQDRDVRRIVQVADGRLWLAVADAGLVVVDPVGGGSERVRRDADMPGSLAEANVTALFLDRSGLLWVGGESRGFSTVDPRGTPFRYVFDDAADPLSVGRNNVHAIAEDGVGKFWLGTSDGLKHYDRGADKFESFDHVLAKAPGSGGTAARQITALRLTRDGTLWIGSERGVYALDVARRQATMLPIDTRHGLGLPSPHVSALLQARDGSFWFGSADAGVAHWWPDTRRWEFFRHIEGSAASIANDSVRCLFEDRGGRIWFGTPVGVSVHDPKQQTLRSFRPAAGRTHALSDGAVNAILQSGEGTIWIGTNGGLNRLDGDADGNDVRFNHFLPRDGLAGSAIYGMLEDRDGMLWLGTNHGVSQFDPEQNLFHNFTPKDGLQGLEFNVGAALALGSGELAFAGSDGLNLLDPAAIQFSRYAAPVVITSLQVDSRTRTLPSPGEELVMAQSERVLRFEFAALDFAAPARNQFTYRLEGFDDAWVKAGARHDATYTNLPAGDYRFEVRGSNRDGAWSEQGASVALRVDPPWWAARLMLALYAASALLVIARVSRQRRAKREAELRHHRELAERENRLRLALWGSGDEFWDWDLRHDEVLVTGGGDLLRGSSDHKPLATASWITENVHEDDRDAVTQQLLDHVNGASEQFESQHRVRRDSGQWSWVFVRGKIVERGDNGEALRICGTVRDITALRAAERERRISAEVIDSMAEAVCVTDLDFCFVSVNRAFTRMTGYDSLAVIGQSAALLNCAKHPPELYQSMREQFVRQGHWRGELWQKRKDGVEFLCWLEISVVLDAAGERTHYVGVMSDITDRKRAEQELRYLANYDTMTGLPNRALLGERLGRAIHKAGELGQRVAILFLDLDRFKHVNDSMGHVAGDRTLRAAGARLRVCIEPSDTVARLGGDEFTVVLENLTTAQDAENVARQLLVAFTAPLHLESGEEVVISPSIGISLYPDHSQEPQELLKFADTAMYQAKERGRNTYAVYVPAMHASARSRAGLITALHRGLERNEFSVVYQPKLSLRSGRITGVEALVRWHNEELGDIPPATFIPLAEEIGLIGVIGDFVLNAACAQLRRWHDKGLTGLTVAVNLSMLQLMRGEMAPRLRQILDTHGVRADQLELELTETVVMAAAEQSLRTLTELKAIGVTLAIDDFGTGYSSLSYLKRLPIDTLKIDQAFVGDITTDPDDAAITSTIITMAHSLGLNVIAEGVETAEQLAYLRGQDCDEIQGHWFSRPLGPDACFAFLTQAQHAPSPPVPA